MDHDGPLVTVTLDGAQRTQLMGALRAVGRGLTGDIRIAVIRCPAAPWSLVDDDAPGDPLGWLGRPDLLSIAVLTGRVQGPALHLALACDLRMAAQDVAVSTADTEGGLSLQGVGALTRLLGPASALELAVTGRDLTAAEVAALAVVVPAADLEARLRELTDRILARPREDVIALKALARRAGSRTHEAQWQAERSAQASRPRVTADTEE